VDDAAMVEAIYTGCLGTAFGFLPLPLPGLSATHVHHPVRDDCGPGNQLTGAVDALSHIHP
jgi:hypothetical protein